MNLPITNCRQYRSFEVSDNLKQGAERLVLCEGFTANKYPPAEWVGARVTIRRHMVDRPPFSEDSKPCGVCVRSPKHGPCVDSTAATDIYFTLNNHR